MQLPKLQEPSRVAYEASLQKEKEREVRKDIQKIEIHPWTKNKGITKAIESLKLTKEQKEELRKIRNKKSS